MVFPMTLALGRSVQGREIGAYVFRGTPKRTVLVLGGFHGDEPKGVFVARRWIDLLRTERDPVDDARWVVVPLVNPDGYAKRRRRNAHRVDINRNFPTKNWAGASKQSRMYGGPTPASEPETQAVMNAVRRFRPMRIVTIHSIGLDRHCNNYDGPGRALALAMRRYNHYPVTASIGYPTPGSFGTWAGGERNIATITLELPSHHSPKRCWDDNRLALLCVAR
jgi:protein MpaA